MIEVHVISDTEIEVSPEFIVGSYEKLVVFAAAGVRRGYSYMGSGMPLPNEDAALRDTENSVVMTGPTDPFRFSYPSAYYDSAKNVVPPTVYCYAYLKGGNVDRRAYPLPNPHPLRSLEHRPERWEKGPMYYQERIDRTPYTAGVHAANLHLARQIKTQYGTG